MTRILTALLAALTFGVAQERAPFVAGEDFAIEDVAPFGDVTVDYEIYDRADRGALVLSQRTPTDQHANFDVVGPDDYWQHFDFSDDNGVNVTLDDLAPGIYSVAATDEGLELAHAVVEVRAGEATLVGVELTTISEIYAPGGFDPYNYWGTYEGYEDAQPGYPYGAYERGADEERAGDGGALALEGVPDGVDVVVTGPGGFSEGRAGDGVLEELEPGIYAVAASGEGTDLAATTVEIRPGWAVALAFAAGAPPAVTFD